MTELDKKWELVAYRLAQSKETLEEAVFLLEGGKSLRAVTNRAYYSMFYAIRTQQVTNPSTERQLLKFYTKSERAAYLEVRGDAVAINAKESYKFSFRAPSHTVRCPEAGIIFFVHTIY